MRCLVPVSASIDTVSALAYNKLPLMRDTGMMAPAKALEGLVEKRTPMGGVGCLCPTPLWIYASARQRRLAAPASMLRWPATVTFPISPEAAAESSPFGNPSAGASAFSLNRGGMNSRFAAWMP